MKITKRFLTTVALAFLLVCAGVFTIQSACGPEAAAASVMLLMGLGLCLAQRPVLGDVVQLADVYNPLTFARRTQQAQIELNRFISSGVAVADGEMAAQIAQGGNIGDLSNYAPLTMEEPNYSSDDPTSLSTPKKISKEVAKFRSASRNQSWSTMDLARELALEDPVGAITGRIGAYWATDDQSRLINSLLGVLADNQDNDGGDMVIDLATDSSDPISDDERVGGEAMIDAMQTLGDHKEIITTIALHSVIYTRLQKQQLITFVRDADNNVMFATYMGKRIIIDDGLPAVAGDNRVTYTSILFGAGAVATANGKVLVPSELFRIPGSGNGGGQDVIYSRVHNVFHPIGFSFLSANVAGKSPTYAELADGDNWNRIYLRKNIPIAFLKTND